MVRDGVAGVCDFGPGLEGAGEDVERGGREQDVEGEGCAGEFALVGAVAAEGEEGGFGEGDAVQAAETGGLGHGGVEGEGSGFDWVGVLGEARARIWDKAKVDVAWLGNRI